MNFTQKRETLGSFSNLKAPLSYIQRVLHTPNSRSRVECFTTACHIFSSFELEICLVGGFLLVMT